MWKHTLVVALSDDGVQVVVAQSSCVDISSIQSDGISYTVLKEHTNWQCDV